MLKANPLTCKVILVSPYTFTFPRQLSSFQISFRQSCLWKLIQILPDIPNTDLLTLKTFFFLQYLCKTTLEWERFRTRSYDEHTLVWTVMLNKPIHPICHLTEKSPDITVIYSDTYHGSHFHST